VQKAGDAMIIDVREYNDYKKSRIKNAVNIPSSGNLEFASDTLNRSHHLFFYCSSGIRSKKVAKYFSQRGFDNIYSLEGGFTAWKKSGFPVEKKKTGRR
jgi:thiosulfate sulfurtransferase